jgi:type I restriction enzyme M protein
LFIDASGAEHYRKEKTQNVLTEEGLQRITAAYQNYAVIDGFACLATKAEIQENDFNLNIPRYVDTFQEEAPVDMEAVNAYLSDRSRTQTGQRKNGQLFNGIGVVARKSLTISF